MSYLRSSTGPLMADYDCALLDLDGVVYRGEHAVPHAVDAIASIRKLGLRTMFVTNNASRSPHTVANHLTELGVPTGAEEVTTAAMAAAALIAAESSPQTRVLVVGGPGLREAVTAEGLTVVDSADDAPTVVVQGFDPSVSWPDLAEAVYAIAAGAQHIASNLDVTLPTARGFGPGNGALVAAVVAATGVQPRSTGKPQPEIFLQAARQAAGRAPLVIGDRLNTDLAGARAADLPGLHVLTGVDGAAELIRAVPADRPSYVSADLRGLGDVHPAVVQDGAWWTCGTAAATIRDGGLVWRTDNGELVAGGGEGRALALDMDQVRAGAAAAWAASDRAGVPSILGPDFGQLTVTTPDQLSQER